MSNPFQSLKDLHMVDFNTEYISEEFAKDAFANQVDGERIRHGE